MKTTEFARLQVRVSKDAKRAFRVYCAEQGITIQEGVERAIEKMVGKQKPVKEAKNAG